MESLDILYAMVITSLIGLLGLWIGHTGRQKKLSIFSLQGRLNRSQFILGTIILFVILNGLSTLTQLLIIDAVVILATYWAVRIAMLFGLVLITPFLITVFARRLHDISLPSWPAIPWTFFIIYTYVSNPVKNISLIYDMLIIVVLVLLTLPNNTLPNQYGMPQTWPASAPLRRRNKPIRTRTKSLVHPTMSDNSSVENLSWREELLSSKQMQRGQEKVTATLSSNATKKTSIITHIYSKATSWLHSLLTLWSIVKEILQTIKTRLHAFLHNHQ